MSEMTEFEKQAWECYDKVEGLGSLPDLDEDFERAPQQDEQLSGHWGDMELVGHASAATNDKCGSFMAFFGCDRVDLHGIVTLNGANYSGKVFSRKVFRSCDNPRCPVCYKYGWASREAHKIEERLAKAASGYTDVDGVKHQGLGLVEHIVASVPERFYGLSFEEIRAKAIKALYARGVIGGVIIWHGFRYSRYDVVYGRRTHMRGWYWSPHFHCLGFIGGGYGKCRSCKKCARSFTSEGGKMVERHGSEKVCAGCGGFEERTRQLYKKDGFIVVVEAKRQSVGGTAWYQLNHSAVQVSKKRFHIASWFGVCSYRKLKVTVEKRKEVCPICQHELRKLRYFGNKHFCYDRDSPDFKRDEFCDLFEDGFGMCWIAAGEHDFG